MQYMKEMLYLTAHSTPFHLWLYGEGNSSNKRSYSAGQISNFTELKIEAVFIIFRTGYYIPK